MTPYYDDGQAVIYHGDALQFLQDWDAAPVDCVLTDPPYCSGATVTAQRGKRAATTPESVRARPTIEMDSMGLLGYEWVTRRWLLDARRVTTPGGHLLCFTDWRMSPWLQTMLETAGWRLTNLVVWNKGYPGLGTGFRAQHEFVLIASNGEPTWYSYDFGNVLTSNRITDGQHPHQKPEDIVRRLLQTCCPPGGTVLDPHMGSGTTLRVAKDLGMRGVGMEIDERYCALAVKRLGQETLEFS